MAAAPIIEQRVLYLYGITEANVRPLPELVGVDRVTPVESIESNGILCWVSRVPALDFEKNLARNMEDLDWLAETSVAHQRVIAAIARETEILPARLATIFRNETSLYKHIGKRARALKSDFARIRGADEWGIKVFAIPRPVSTFAAVRTGKDYLEAKAGLLPERRRKQDQGLQIAKFERALERIAAERAPAGNVSRGQRGLTFQTTLLIRRSDRRKFESLLEKFARDWQSERRIECTGPWPPYSFVSRPDRSVKSK
jgi:Gas vesicle synthesis protein GvpL/GvpF